MPITERAANLRIIPDVLPDTSTHVSLGDIHGNALKLIYVLIEEGVLKLSDDNDGTAADKYRILREIYFKPVNSLTEGDLGLFQKIINNASVSNAKAVTLIGDELADRGSNDYFTLLVLKKLKNANVNIDIILSNHSVEFLKDYERTIFSGRADLGSGQAQSLANMRQLIARGLIQEDDIRRMVDEFYKPMVKGIGYTLAPNGDLNIFTHAPIGLETIQALARKFDIPYSDQNPVELIETIDAINIKIQTQFGEKNLAALIAQEGSTSPYEPVPPQTHPLHRLVWNRNFGNELLTKPSGDFIVNFIHGHVGDNPVLQNGRGILSHQNLDSSFGKPGSEQTGDNGYGYERHLTRQSSDFTQQELTAEKIGQILNIWSKGVAEKQLKQLDIEIRSHRASFNSLLDALKVKTNELIQKGDIHDPDFDPEYVRVAQQARELISTLESAGNKFFSEEITGEQYQHFKTTCEGAISGAEKVFAEKKAFILNSLNGGLKRIQSLRAY
jgi:hypothetical protein